MTLSLDWAGRDHLLRQPWIPPEFVTNFGELTTRLDGHETGLVRLKSNRKDCRSYGSLASQDEAEEQLLRLRAELIVADRLLDVGVEVEIRPDTPDLKCRFEGHDFGVEVATRQPKTIEQGLRARLAEIGGSRPGSEIHLRRQQLVFHMPDEVRKRAIDQVVTAVASNEYVKLDLVGTGLTAVVTPGASPTPQHHLATMNDLPGHHCAYWPTLADEIKQTISEKAEKNYAIDSVLALDVTRLGRTGQWPITVEEIGVFDRLLDETMFEWGPLKGILLFRSWLWDPADPTANTLRLITHRGGDMARRAAELLSNTRAATITTSSEE